MAGGCTRPPRHDTREYRTQSGTVNVSVVRWTICFNPRLKREIVNVLEGRTHVRYDAVYAALSCVPRRGRSADGRRVSVGSLGFAV